MHATVGAAGALLAGGLAVAARRRGPRREAQILAIGLVVAATIYGVFAAVGGAAARWLGIETAGVLLYGAVAWIGLRRDPLWLAAGWLLHIAWDVGLHGAATAFVPLWYPPLCVGFDLAIGLWVMVRRRDLSLPT